MNEAVRALTVSDHPFADPDRLRLLAAGITSGLIQEPSAKDPRQSAQAATVSPRTEGELQPGAISMMSPAIPRERPAPESSPILSMTAIHEARPLTDRFLDLALTELSQNQTIAELARRLGHSLAQLDRACLQSRGRSALQLLYDLRLERAVNALRDSDMPIHEIARELGYSGQAHFIRSFAAATGRSPQAYRDFMRGAGRCPAE